MSENQVTAEEGFAFELWQGGIMVASVEASHLEDARREIMHYAMVYGQDGPCEIRGAAVAALAPESAEITPEVWDRLKAMGR